jgi:hypothetical protein
MINQNSERRPRKVGDAIHLIAQEAIDLATAAAQSVNCASCRATLPAILLASSEYFCPHCLTKVCVMCGCTDQSACNAGCYWIAPGICSTHEEELVERVEAMFGQVA